MITTKLFEVRDSMTFIPVIASMIDTTAAGYEEYYLLRRVGFLSPLVWISKLTGHPENATYDPHDWKGNRTMRAAHEHIQKHFAELPSGAVIDVEFLLGISDAPKTSERLDAAIPTSERVGDLIDRLVADEELEEPDEK